ncbi:hypothetical protein DHEL01_v206197 [Diaporthe helianthi]|uniref:PLC-like phosphodiesterase n=1 Tax=Diaporthe helianthi TaxID=158607 RepID=A0A2P5HYT8_DIAHE|nr:hypothetical protein DHEL01_v206197 [Diaporthe helianthi]
MPSLLSLGVAWLGLATIALAACNGQDALCSRSYGNVTFVGSHNSAFVGLLPSQNQLLSVEDQLGLGVRFLQAQTHNLDGTIEMCHTSCIELDQGSLTEYLEPIKTFMDANPNEVVSLLLTNGDDIPVSRFADVFAAVGLEQYAFTPSGALSLDQWPTLQTMIDDGTRLVIWMDYNSDTAATPYILDEFAYYFETSYEVTDDAFPSCAIDRPSAANADGRMGLVNHMLHVDIFGIQIPDLINANKTNSLSSIDAQAGICEGLYGRTPNVILLDYVNLGDAMGAQAALNGL